MDAPHQDIILDYIKREDAAQRAASPFNLEITLTARRSIEDRLRALPQICEAAEEAVGAEAVCLNCEIDTMKRALAGISGDPYYHLLTDLYFNGFSEREASFRADCTIPMLQKHRHRLLDKLAFLAYGVLARTWNPFTRSACLGR